MRILLASIKWLKSVQIALLEQSRTLIRMNVLISNCRGQYYDGVSNVTGSKRGVAAQIAREGSQALFIHCFAHSLNLTVADTLEQSKVSCVALETALEVTKLIKFSPNRNAMFNQRLCWW